MHRPIQINAQQYSALQFEEAAIIACVHMLDISIEHTVPEGELSIAFLSDELIAKVHEDFMQDPTPTDVITFPGDQDMEFAGEICISVDHALAASKEYETEFKEELTLYLVHGFLHLAGLDDIEETDRLKMRAAEAITMQTLRNMDAIPNFSIAPDDK